MTKTDELNTLFADWEKFVPEYTAKFVRDGIVNEEAYLLAHTKILFLTKEPNNPGQTPGDFREWWKEGIKYGFSFRLAEWAFGILNDFPPYDEIWKTKDNVNHAIRSIAFMNVKKSGGGGLAEYDRMIEHATKNKDFISKQIDIIQPEIIITGLSWPELRCQVFPDLAWMESGYGIAIARCGDKKIIDFYHPSARTAPAASYSLLQNVIRAPPFRNL
jgi:hypothetical protein